MRFAVEAWDPSYGSSSDEALVEPGETPVDVGVEVDEASWEPRRPATGVGPVESVLFVDGVLRVDARVWVQEDGTSSEQDRPGLCGSYAAGAVWCAELAEVRGIEVRRGLFSAAANLAPVEAGREVFVPMATVGTSFEPLYLGLQQRMRELEVEVARRMAEGAELIVVDGPLTDRRSIPGAVGYVKSHHAGYLPDSVVGVVGRLEDGERTPVFLATTKWSRFSWYVRLPGARAHAWSGIVRCEASADRPLDEVVELADRVTATLPRYASTPHKDARSPQNLFPIAGLERRLRHRLGDPELLVRSLRVAAAHSR